MSPEDLEPPLKSSPYSAPSRSGEAIRCEPAPSTPSLTVLLRMALGQTPTPNLATGHRRGLDALLAFWRQQQGEALSPEERRAVAAGATTWSMIELALEEVSATLGEAGIQFVLLKGAASATLFPLPELRTTSDLDLLLHRQDLPSARKALIQGGWDPVVVGRFAEAYLQEEGTCWQAHQRGRPVIELHFRFWGSVTDGFEQRVLSAASQRSDGQWVPCPSHSLIIAAAHGCRQATPRRAVDFLDVCLLLSNNPRTAFDNLLKETSAAGQELPVALALDIAARTLEADWLQALNKRAASILKYPERRLLKRGQHSGLDSVPWTQARLAALLALRPSRAGWRSLKRQVWPHSGVLEQRTSDQLSWPARRAQDLRRKVQSLL